MKEKPALVMVFLSPLVLLAQDSEPTKQNVVQAIMFDEPIKLDGVLDEKV